MLEKTLGNSDLKSIFQVPETSFVCDGQVNGGYYGDPEAECQVFHICTQDGAGGLSKYSFLCPNGTIFNQEYFICDWWFNFDCSEAEGLYSLNDDIAAEREAATQGRTMIITRVELRPAICVLGFYTFVGSQLGNHIANEINQGLYYVKYI